MLARPNTPGFLLGKVLIDSFVFGPIYVLVRARPAPLCAAWPQLPACMLCRGHPLLAQHVVW